MISFFSGVFTLRLPIRKAAAISSIFFDPSDILRREFDRLEEVDETELLEGVGLEDLDELDELEDVELDGMGLGGREGGEFVGDAEFEGVLEGASLEDFSFVVFSLFCLTSGC